jgi:hypothetical protein
MTYYRPPERESLRHALLWRLLSLLSLLALPLIIRVLLVPWVWLIGAVVLVGLVLPRLFRLVR